MAKKRKITKKDILSMYMDYVLEHGKNPRSILKFAKEHNFEEAEFYRFHGNFDALEQSIFTWFFDETLHLLENNESYQSYDARNKLLSFYYTFFELLTANRSYIVFALKGKKSKLKSLKSLSGLRKAFVHYVESLNIEMLEFQNEHLQQLQTKSLKEGAWFQLLITLKFWLDDVSSSFEKTDVFIEKAVNASFDLISIQPIKSVMDLSKFLFKEKIKMSS